eukprot:TRINITY_DN12722_c1_g1_i1.p1 TRINITY_DN12722_c1_g1~~TRINITY_DN12722_c1_g1_i1.p1  ORF type:complete len:303 (+),score=84.00 TRINITY_DN12722_c1_g1_i1:157-1065(+)
MEETHVSLRSYAERVVEAADYYHKRLDTLRRDKTSLQATCTHLEAVSSRLTHKIAVPVGPKAFFWGSLVHTNEFLCLLGDNWFCKKTGKGAVGLLKRRMKVVDAAIEEAEMQLELLRGRIHAFGDMFGSESASEKDAGGDVVEIREPAGEEVEMRASSSSHSSRVTTASIAPATKGVRDRHIDRDRRKRADEMKAKGGKDRGEKAVARTPAEIFESYRRERGVSQEPLSSSDSKIVNVSGPREETYGVKEGIVIGSVQESSDWIVTPPSHESKRKSDGTLKRPMSRFQKEKLARMEAMKGKR